MRQHHPESLVLAFSDHLASMSFILHGEPVGTLKTPRLLWECSCSSTVGGCSPDEGPCRVHSLPRGTDISRSFGKNTIVRYRGVDVVWDSTRAWPPSIDSLVLVQALNRGGWPPRTVTRLFDLGAGTGVVGLHLCANNKHIKRLVGVESSVSAADQCMSNYHAVFGKCTAALEPLVLCKDIEELGPGSTGLSDAVVMNPPYFSSKMELQSRTRMAQAFTHGDRFLDTAFLLATAQGSPVAFSASSVCNLDNVHRIAESRRYSLSIIEQRMTPMTAPVPEHVIQDLVRNGQMWVARNDVFRYHHLMSIHVGMPPARVRPSHYQGAG